MSGSFQVTFGQLAARLADLHGIAPDKRTAFQSRLKNFHRLGFPIGMQTTMGKAALYSAADAAFMALAIEMTQLGLTPERIVWTLRENQFATMMAFRLAARELVKRPMALLSPNEDADDPLSMFLYFDAWALAPLAEPGKPIWDRATDAKSVRAFFYGGVGVVTENLHRWTTGRMSRLSLINVTAMLSSFVGAPAGGENTPEWRSAVFQEIVDWSEALEAAGDFEDESSDYILDFAITQAIAMRGDESPALVNAIQSATGLATAEVARALAGGARRLAGRLSDGDRS